MKTGLVFHELYLWHHTGNHADYVPYGLPVEPLHHSESPDSKRRITGFFESEVTKKKRQLPLGFPIISYLFYIAFYKQKRLGLKFLRNFD